MGRRISHRLDAAILTAKAENRLLGDGDFLWLKDNEHLVLRIYAEGGVRRRIDQIPPQEISLAIIECVQNSMSILEDDLVREVAKLFGLRATKKVSGKIKLIISDLIFTEQLVQQHGKIVINSVS